MAAFFAAALLAATFGTPEIRIEVVPGRGYAATVPVIDENQYSPVIERIKLMAAERCGRQNVRF